MKIFVCVKQVPDTQGKVYLKKDGSIDRARMATIINPDDLAATEIALRIKDQIGAKVIAVTMGPDTAKSMMQELTAMGVDESVIVSARELVGSDTYGTSQVLAAAIKSLGFCEEDMIICGQQAIDGDTAQVGPEMAEKLGIAQVTNTVGVKYVDGAIQCERVFEDRVMDIELNTPCLVCCKKEAAEHRYMNIRRIFDWDDSSLSFIRYNALRKLPLFDENVVGITKAPTIVFTSFALPKKGQATMLEGSAAEMASKLTAMLTEQHVI